ncbi:hypothetical protein GGS23DRAFT_126872 [Durotheca rogersii]|uniref:uncharacterized protein n=1 Tax=Durotheca rogersii TaxID=419775 RepID=UPI00221E8EA9|nr:uncharacterized protein GGS23DRAFT_126872 [Durotheca rogersii]KAI5861702.1 hypothetical protein GGS23DRAFT_126872 [Durotheca rogersii]
MCVRACVSVCMLYYTCIGVRRARVVGVGVDVCIGDIPTYLHMPCISRRSRKRRRDKEEGKKALIPRSSAGQQA